MLLYRLGLSLIFLLFCFFFLLRRHMGIEAGWLPVCSWQRAAETSSKMEVVKQREAPSIDRQTDRQKEREAVREEQRELDQHKDTHGIQIMHRLDKQLARQRQTAELTHTHTETDG